MNKYDEKFNSSERGKSLTVSLPLSRNVVEEQNNVVEDY
jgi:hypothetical protein